MLGPLLFSLWAAHVENSCLKRCKRGINTKESKSTKSDNCNKTVMIKSPLGH